jgi:MoaA/NifB/PqqE/SkfB family radical SAM enzyme
VSVLRKFYERESFRDLFRVFVMNRRVRAAAVPFIEKLLYKKVVEEDTIGRSPGIQRDKYYMMAAILHSVDRGLRRGAFSKHVVGRLFKVFVENVLLNEGPRRVKEKTGRWPPFFVTISPTQRCNLSCEGCYAASRPGAGAQLEYDVVAEVLSQKRRLWGSFFTVISGGEPFLWDDGGKGILDLAADFPDEFFIMFTNGTLIDADVARRLEELGNITPAISLEGFEDETNRRRGRGVFEKILAAFDYLRRAGVPFGISATAVRDNAEVVMGRGFSDFYFREQGAIYGWIFQYMPIGRAPALELMVTPEQRLRMYRRLVEMVRDERLLVVDFWNSGPVTNGCMAAGRPFGYLYIDWHGNATPCVFVPYAAGNVREVFARGGDLDEVLESGLFADIRRWQDEYGYDRECGGKGDWIAPCVNRDHYRVLRRAVERNGAEPVDDSAAAALRDEEYARRLAAYGEAFRALADDVWEREYLS